MIFSVIMPVYNREKSVLKSINSVLNQSFKEFELILIDDCSTDNSYTILSNLKDKRIKLFRLDKNSGPGIARNAGIAKSQGKFISFLDSDDQFEPEFLQNTFDKFSATSDNIGFCWSGIRYHLGENCKEYIWNPKIIKDSYHTFLDSIYIGTSAGVTVKREVFDAYGGFNENLLAAEDTEFFLRITKKYDFLVIEKILVNIFKGGGDRLSKNFRKIALAYNQFMQDHLSEIDKSNYLKNKYYYKMMWLNFHIPQKEKAIFYRNQIKGRSLKEKFKIAFVFNLYNYLPLSLASKIHQKFSF